MAEGYTLLQTDQRTLGQLVDRLIDDLNRPDLQAICIEYVQDAIRYYQRMPFFFNEADNTPTATYANGTIWPQGSLIQVTIAGTAYAMVALNTGTSAAVGTPAWPAAIFTVPSAGTIPPPTVGTAGTVVDNTIMWGNAGLWTSAAWTQLSTVYSINQYQPDLGYISPERIEITVPNLRFELQKITYQQLRDYDVIRIGGSQSGIVASYPTMWAWFQQQIYIWPYPNAFYPLTISSRRAPVLITQMTDSNFWTTQAERLIRKRAQALIERDVMHDMEAAQASVLSEKDEMRVLRGQTIAQHNPSNAGIPASDW